MSCPNLEVLNIVSYYELPLVIPFLTALLMFPKLQTLNCDTDFRYDGDIRELRRQPVQHVEHPGIETFTLGKLYADTHAQLPIDAQEWCLQYILSFFPNLSSLTLLDLSVVVDAGNLHLPQLRELRVLSSPRSLRTRRCREETTLRAVFATSLRGLKNLQWLVLGQEWLPSDVFDQQEIPSNPFHWPDPAIFSRDMFKETIQPLFMALTEVHTKDADECPTSGPLHCPKLAHIRLESIRLQYDLLDSITECLRVRQVLTIGNDSYARKDGCLITTQGCLLVTTPDRRVYKLPDVLNLSYNKFRKVLKDEH
jgi:hypothetical protein